MCEENEQGFDCPSECADHECHYMRELADGTIVSVSCYGTCNGRCAGLFDPTSAHALATRSPAKPDRLSRITARARELYFEPPEGRAAERFDVSCAVGCFVGHAAAATAGPADCYGSCLGICYGLAVLTEVQPAIRGERK